ncbi:hypothetical protein OV079_52360 [Nannocystis pusilla]|uniref:Uncharacterized protein n=1 Tax=Nannocystis pusilla TaxID=889268 RepID=A0A9X3F903_9BACT|nr:hypothetical protein [Nannocystis pusilla]MCY1013983.1 hypothetical protein [Nannocystis pusilla]
MPPVVSGPVVSLVVEPPGSVVSPVVSPVVVVSGAPVSVSPVVPSLVAAEVVADCVEVPGAPVGSRPVVGASVPADETTEVWPGESPVPSVPGALEVLPSVSLVCGDAGEQAHKPMPERAKRNRSRIVRRSQEARGHARRRPLSRAAGSPRK